MQFRSRCDPTAPVGLLFGLVDLRQNHLALPLDHLEPYRTAGHVFPPDDHT